MSKFAILSARRGDADQFTDLFEQVGIKWALNGFIAAIQRERRYHKGDDGDEALRKIWVLLQQAKDVAEEVGL